MNIYVSEINGEFQVSFTGYETKKEVETDLWEGEHLIHFCQFNENESGELEEAVGVIEAISCLASTREILEKLLTTIYRLGR